MLFQCCLVTQKAHKDLTKADCLIMPWPALLTVGLTITIPCLARGVNAPSPTEMPAVAATTQSVTETGDF